MQPPEGEGKCPLIHSFFITPILCNSKQKVPVFCACIWAEKLLIRERQEDANKPEPGRETEYKVFDRCI